MKNRLTHNLLICKVQINLLIHKVQVNYQRNKLDSEPLFFMCVKRQGALFPPGIGSFVQRLPVKLCSVKIICRMKANFNSDLNQICLQMLCPFFQLLQMKSLSLSQIDTDYLVQRLLCFTSKGSCCSWKMKRNETYSCPIQSDLANSANYGDEMVLALGMTMFSIGRKREGLNTETTKSITTSK